MHYHPLTKEDKDDILKSIGATSFEALIDEIPAKLRNPEVDLPEGLSEIEIQSLIKELGRQNKTSKDTLSFLGAGSYDHFIPASVAQLASRNEFYTAYTPYQPEASQGTLQSIYEYQSLMTELTGLDVSNASHYDGATSMAEAAILALRHTDRTKVLISRSVHPHYIRVLKTYLEGTPYEVEEFGMLEDTRFDAEDFESKINDKVAAAIFQTPNFFGTLEELDGVSEKLKEQGALLIVSSNPISLGVLKTPGEWGADIAVGEGQPLGIPTQFGGPYLGYFSVTRALMRKVPGRLAGITKDTEGKRAYVLTLQAREQHIRRERASSNICTNQALCALTACIYMTLLGKEGIREVGEINMDRAYYLRDEIAKLPGYHVDTDLPIFNEFVVKLDKNASNVEKKLLKKDILPGVDLGKFYPEMKNSWLVCATETKTKEQLDQFVEALAQC